MRTLKITFYTAVNQNYKNTRERHEPITSERPKVATIKIDQNPPITSHNPPKYYTCFRNLLDAFGESSYVIEGKECSDTKNCFPYLVLSYIVSVFGYNT